MAKHKINLNTYQTNFLNYILISFAFTLTIICGSNLYQILASSISPFEFDTVYVINMVTGFIKNGLPSSYNIYGNSVWTCSETIPGECFNPNILNLHQNDVFPIDHSSGYIMVFLTGIISKIFIIFNPINDSNSVHEIFGIIIKSYSIYCVLIYFFCAFMLMISLYFINKAWEIGVLEKIVLFLIFLTVPFCGIYAVTNRIIGEFTAVIFLSSAYLIFGASSLTLIKYQINKLYLRAETKAKYRSYLKKTSLVLFLLLFLAVEAKSSVLPGCLAIFISQIIIYLNQEIFESNLNTFPKIIKNLIKFISKRIILISLSIGSLFFANKSIPLLGYLIFKIDSLSEFITKSKAFISYQSNAGKNWGGESMTIIQNIKNNFNSYKMSEFIIPISLLFTGILILIFIYKIYKNISLHKSLEIKYIEISSISLTFCNLLILLGSWSYSLIYKFPYPRNLYISIVFSLLVPIVLSLFYKNIFFTKMIKE